MYSSIDVANRIKEVAAQKQLLLKDVLEKADLNRNTMTNFKTSMPKADNLAKIADALDCSVDYLLGRSEQKKEAPLKAGLNEELTWNEALIVGTYRQLPPKLQSVAMYLIDSLANAAENNIDILNYSAKDSAAG